MNAPSTILDIGIAALALYLTVDMKRFLRTAQRAEGTLVGYNSERDDEGDWLYRPIFRFEDENCNPITASNPRHIWVVRRLAVGQTCTVLYSPNNPACVFRDTWLDLWFLPAVLWTITIIALFRTLSG